MVSVSWVCWAMRNTMAAFGSGCRPAKYEYLLRLQRENVRATDECMQYAIEKLMCLHYMTEYRARQDDVEIVCLVVLNSHKTKVWILNLLARHLEGRVLCSYRRT
jgi:hypothetical protein